MAPSSADKQQAKAQGHATEDIDGEHNEWKFRAPYKIHENGHFKAVLEGGCHCGRVQYQLSRERPLKAKFCHCKTCQRIHGAPFQHAAIFKKGDINFLKGHHDLKWYESGEKTTRHKLPCKVSCAYCGSLIMDEGRKMILLFPGLIEWGEGEKGREKRAGWEAECHMFYENRVVDILDGKPKWAGMQGESELIEDSPPEEIKKRKREMEEEEEKREQEKKKAKKDDGAEDGGPEVKDREKNGRADDDGEKMVLRDGKEKAAGGKNGGE
ncbi:uncharacterized protein L3040_002808 [Drepanopeziza brunnea f. sp. 'multigermtubi']|uniref:uncharacterized protein n=1 Tax=Drepanopeziza brunnea f. sp. 'multigermtubi' TaxID=698441 RepID=UPI00239BF6AF|nr:hypothetical protein L3040_002808 [Drepanopeziza brunnea f. sp. 'multigermtubi']